ncbi:TolC family protein [Sulfurimonas sp.]
MKKIFFINFLLLSLLGAKTLTLQESIDKTLANHPDIKSFALKIEQSKAGYKSAYSGYLPQVNAQAQYNALQTFVFPFNGVFNTVDDDSWSAGASLKQKVWDFSKTSAKVDAFKVDEKISKLSLADLKALMVYRVKALYDSMVVQNEAIQVRVKDLESKKAYYEQAKALVKNGLKTEADASRFLSAVYVAQDNLAIAHATYNKAKSTLSLYMNENIADDVDLESKLLTRDFNPSQNTQKEIEDENYQLKIYKYTTEKNRLLHKSAKAAHYGSIDAYASYTHFDTLNTYDSKLAGISLSIPIYSGGMLSAEAQKAEIAAQISSEQKASKLLALKDELNSLLIDIERYNKTIEAKKAQMDAAMSTKNVLEGRYKEGLATYIEVLDATSLVLNAKLGLLEAYYQKSMAINRIEYLKGKI